MKTNFPCSGCGCCCKRVGLIPIIPGFDFPYKSDSTGKCEMLDDNNKCTIYETRPLICRIDSSAKYFDMSKKQYRKLNIVHCNMMMDEDNVPLKFRIK